MRAPLAGSFRPLLAGLISTHDISLLEHVSAIEWDNVVLYGQYILDRKLVTRRRFAKGSSLAYKLRGSL
jgi:hypothetical protein